MVAGLKRSSSANLECLSAKRQKIDPVSIVSWNVDHPVSTGILDLQSNKLSSYFTTDSKHKPNSLRPFLRAQGFPHFLCLQEIRARPSDRDWISALKASPNVDVKPDEPLYNTHLSLCKSKIGARRFGVAVYIRDDVPVDRVKEVDWDHEGRCIIVESSKWSLFAVYALNSSEYPYKNPMTNQPTGQTRSQRKKEFNRLLLAEIQKSIANDKPVIAIGDFNITLTAQDCFPRLRTEEPHATSRRIWIEGFGKAGLVDVYRQLHPSERKYSWFAKNKPHGSDAARVDYALVSESLVNQVVESTYLEDPAVRGKSDHAPVVLRFIQPS